MRAGVCDVWRPTILEPMSAAIRTIVLAKLLSESLNLGVTGHISLPACWLLSPLLCAPHACAGVRVGHESLQPPRKQPASSLRTGFVCRAVELRHTPEKLRSRWLALCHDNGQQNS